MVVNTEVLLRAWRERWSPLQWLVEVKKVAGKDREELQDLAGNFSFTVNEVSLLKVDMNTRSEGWFHVVHDCSIICFPSSLLSMASVTLI